MFRAETKIYADVRNLLTTVSAGLSKVSGSVPLKNILYKAKNNIKNIPYKHYIHFGTGPQSVSQ